MQKQVERYLITGAALWLLMTVMGAAAGPSDLRALLSRVQMMAHEYHSEAQWQQVYDELAAARAAAEQAGRWEDYIEALHLEASVRGLMRGEKAEALTLLENARTRFQDRPIRNVQRLYVLLAEIHARQGNEAAIAELMRQFRASPHYDPIAYPWRGGTGPGDPLQVTRPRATGRDSITLSTMERHRTAARFAPGRRLPSIAGRDAQGRTWNLDHFQGRVVLVDFWVPGFAVWQRQLPALRESYARYRPLGFEIIGIPLIPDVAQARRQAQAAGAQWPQWQVDRQVPAQLGIFGEARNFLVDAQGVIRARDVRGADLDAWLETLLR